MSLFEQLLDQLLLRRPGREGGAAVALRPSAVRRHQCTCGQPLFFRNSRCLACGTEVGYDPARLDLVTLPADGGLVRCANFESAGCNWLRPAADGAVHEGLCRACRLNRTVPDLADPQHLAWWGRIEVAKRRLVSQLLALGLPVASKVSEDREHGLMFDFLRASAAQPVLTGHAAGLITLNVEEADDARREQIRTALHEPYRTLLGHFRHEVGHYYWDRLVAGTAWHAGFRARFGDERADYAAALERHYDAGPAPDWPERCVSAYASTHPWEDWAETWAHYLHMLDTLDTAFSFGISADDVEIDFEPYRRDALDDAAAPGGAEFLRLVNGWLELTAVFNELSRSMGQPDFYPFVLSRPAVAKLHFVHRVVRDAAAATRTSAS